MSLLLRRRDVLSSVPPVPSGPVENVVLISFSVTDPETIIFMNQLTDMGFNVTLVDDGGVEESVDWGDLSVYDVAIVSRAGSYSQIANRIRTHILDAGIPLILGGFNATLGYPSNAIALAERLDFWEDTQHYSQNSSYVSDNSHPITSVLDLGELIIYSNVNSPQTVPNGSYSGTALITGDTSNASTINKPVLTVMEPGNTDLNGVPVSARTVVWGELYHRENNPYISYFHVIIERAIRWAGGEELDNEIELWTPLDLGSKLYAWYDFGDPSTVSFTNNDPNNTTINAISDKSGNNRTLTRDLGSPSTANNSSHQILGKQASVFTQNERLTRIIGSGAIPSSFSLIAVWYQSGIMHDYFRPPIAIGRNGTNLGSPVDRWHHVSSGNRVFVDDTFADRTFTLRNKTTAFVYELQAVKDFLSSGTHRIREYINGAIDESDNISDSWITTNQIITVGCRQDQATHFVGRLGDSVIINGELTDEERGHLNFFLLKKWGISR